MNYESPVVHTLDGTIDGSAPDVTTSGIVWQTEIVVAAAVGVVLVAISQIDITP